MIHQNNYSQLPKYSNNNSDNRTTPITSCSWSSAPLNPSLSKSMDTTLSRSPRCLDTMTKQTTHPKPSPNWSHSFRSSSHFSRSPRWASKKNSNRDLYSLINSPKPKQSSRSLNLKSAVKRTSSPTNFAKTSRQYWEGNITTFTSNPHRSKSKKVKAILGK